MSERAPPCDPFSPGNMAVFASVGALAFAGLVVGDGAQGSAQQPMASVQIGGREFQAPERLAAQIKDALEFFDSRDARPSAASAPAMGRWLDQRASDATRRLTRPKATAWEKGEAREELEHLSVLTHVYEALRNISDGSISAREFLVQVGDQLLVGSLPDGPEAAPVTPSRGHWIAASLVPQMESMSRWEVIYVGVRREVTLLRVDSIGRRRNAEPLVRVPMATLSMMLSTKVAGEPMLKVVPRGAKA